MSIPSRRTRVLVERVLEKLPPDVIGEIYCDEGGRAFFETMRPRIAADGIAWAAALAPRLARGGTSLYVGAGLAELAPMLVEVLDLGRRVVATNLRAEECACLNDALRRAGVDGFELVPEDARGVDVGDDCSHVSLVSVLSDPETYPTVSGVGYGRIPPVLLDVAAFERERRAVRALVDAVLGQLRLPGLLTTTGEEAPWILDWARARDLRADVADTTLRAAVVGDPIGFIALR